MVRAVGKCYRCGGAVMPNQAARVADVVSNPYSPSGFTTARRIVHRGECEAIVRSRVSLGATVEEGVPPMANTKEAPADEWGDPLDVPEPEYTTWDESGPIEGTVVGETEIQTVHGPRWKLILDTADGEVGVWRSSFLTRAFDGIKVGSEVRIVPDGKKGNEKQFKVYVR